MFNSYKSQTISANGINIHCRIGGAGDPLLLLHGHPQTHYIWHKIADKLAERFTVITTDLRGYGDSDKPHASENHINHSKRQMARDQHELMQQLGFTSYSILAHDRGARVAHRMGLDYPNFIDQMMLLDIAPTFSMYEQTNQEFARAYWHWFFLIRPAPLPESLIETSPEQYLKSVMGSRSAGLSPFSDEAFSEYLRCLKLPGAATGICEDYRASATTDLEHDCEDMKARNTLDMPIKVLWGENGVIAKCFDPMKEWRGFASNVVGQELPCGHYIPEEAPELLLEHVFSFFNSMLVRQSN